mmetsp:Transcript_10209/g.27873  ORF Transcript_10209/g.27873 Transcript_10209/m.27873 type:complete len:271 (+) Transcript_10209:176-988(+)
MLLSGTTAAQAQPLHRCQCIRLVILPPLFPLPDLLIPNRSLLSRTRLLLPALTGLRTLPSILPRGIPAHGTAPTLLLILQDCPVEHIVPNEPLSYEQIPEQLSQVGVVWLVVEPQTPRVLEVDDKLCRKPLAERLCWRRHLLLRDFLVLLLFRRCLQTLPRQRPAQEVHQHVAQRLQVIPTGLLNPQVRVDRRIPRRPRQIFVFTVGNVDVRLWVSVLFCQTVVNHVHLVGPTTQPHQKVIRLDISVDEGLRVQVLDSRKHLVCQHQHRL